MALPVQRDPIMSASLCHSRYSKQAFTLVELLTVIACIAILAAIIIPVVGSIVARSNTTKCQSNLRQIGVLAKLYTNEHNGDILPMYYPRDNSSDPLAMTHWTGLLAPYLDYDTSQGSYPSYQSQPIFICPENPEVFGYGHNYNWLSTFSKDLGPMLRVVVRKNTVVANPAQTVFMTDVTRGDNDQWRPFVRPPSMWEGAWDSNAPFKTAFRHPGNTANVLWFDGHVTSETGDSSFTANDELWDTD